MSGWGQHSTITGYLNGSISGIFESQGMGTSLPVYDCWMNVARLREVVGNKEGAEQARKNASLYVERRFEKSAK